MLVTQLSSFSILWHAILAWNLDTHPQKGYFHCPSTFNIIFWQPTTLYVWYEGARLFSDLLGFYRILFSRRDPEMKSIWFIKGGGHVGSPWNSVWEASPVHRPCLIYCVILGAVSQVHNSTYPLDSGGQAGKCASDGLNHLRKSRGRAWGRFMMGQTPCNFSGINRILLYFIWSRVLFELSLLTNRSVSPAHDWFGALFQACERNGALWLAKEGKCQKCLPWQMVVEILDDHLPS